MKENPLDMIWVLLVLGLVFYLVWLVTRFVAVRAKGKTAGRLMRVADRLNISSDKSILVVKIGAEYCVLGVTGHEIRLLKTLDDAEAEAFAQETGRQAQPFPEGSAAATVMKGMQSFSERLGFAMKRAPARPKPEEEAESVSPAEDDGSVIDMMNERIRIRKETKRH